MLLILQVLYFMLPAYCANIAPAIFKVFKKSTTPLDFGIKLWNKPLLGKHKTWEGLAIGTASGFIAGLLQAVLSRISFFSWISIVDYSQWPFYFLGALLGIGALFGDAVKSFFKRRLSIEPGRTFIPFDQIDYVFGAFLFALFLIKPPLKLFLVALPISFLLSFGSNIIAYYLGIKERKW